MYALRKMVPNQEDRAPDDPWAPEDPGLTIDLVPRWPRLVREAVAPTDPDDELYLLGEDCAETYLKADALHHQAMRLLVEFHDRRGWQNTGFSSTAEWLAWRIGIKPGAARERLRTALALEQLPQTSEALRTGEISFTKVRALTRVATPHNETILLEFARAGSAANLERVVRGWKKLDRKSEITAEQHRYRSRRFSAYVDEDGMVVVRGRLDPEAGAVFMRAVEAASDALYREEARGRGSGAGGGTGRGASPEASPSADAMAEFDETSPQQRRADAVGLVAERALASGFGEAGIRRKARPGRKTRPETRTTTERPLSADPGPNGIR